MSKIDLTYNNDVREVEMKLDFYFNSGMVTIDKDDYLVSLKILEETGSGNNWVLGDISSNELSIELMNDNGRFTPTNVHSPYYGEIKSGVKIVPSVRIDKGAWLKMGEYFVDEWSAGVTSSFVNIVAYDKLFGIFDSKPIGLPVSRNILYKEFYNSLLSGLNLTARFGSDITDRLSWGYMLNANSETLQKLTQSIMGVCSCDKNGDIYIRKVTGQGNSITTLKDSDQIIEIDAEHNIQSRYDGSLVTYNTPKESRMVELFSAKDIPIKTGIQGLGKFQFSQPAVTSINSITSEVARGLGGMNIVDIKADSKSIQITTNDAQTNTLLELSIEGKHVVENQISIGKDTPNVLELNNEFIQSRESALMFKNILDKSRSLDLYEVSVNIRGNPTIDVGDKIRIYSPIFDLDFEGIVKQAEYKYDGALSGSLIVVNANLVGEVQ